MWNRMLESMPRADLETLQLSRLKALLTRVESAVPFYKQALSRIKLDKIRTLADVKELPLTTKGDFHHQYPFGLLAVNKEQIKRFHASSGTQGKPTVVGYTKNDLNIWADLCARSLAATGVRSGDILHNAYGYGLFTGGIGIHSGAESLGATVIPASGGKTQQQVRLLKDLGARVLCATPSYALNIAHSINEMGLNPEDFQLALGVFGAEPWTESLRQQIESRLHIKAFDIYGISEVMGPGVSVECSEARCGLHIWEDHFLAEIIDPDSGESLEEGQEGELVITTLTKEAQPVLRFRTGDLTAMTKEPCSCGRTMARMTRVKARLDDMLIVRGVNVYPTQIETLLLKLSELTPHYQLVLRRDENLDALAVQVEMEESLRSEWTLRNEETAKFEELKDRIKYLLKENLGLTVSVDLLPARSIPRSEGKACRLIDLRNK